MTFWCRLLTAMEIYGIEHPDQISWRSTENGFIFAVMCNDVFWQGCSDAEAITMDTVDDLVYAIRQCGEERPRNVQEGLWLYCAKRRKMRPQGEVYSYISHKNWPLFDRCGDEREIGPMNPARRESVKFRR